MSNHTRLCPVCRTPSVEPMATCTVCGTSSDSVDLPLPPISVPAGDHTRLRALATAHRDSSRQVVEFLFDELERASVCRDTPDATVTMESRILFQLDGEHRIECRTLVYPDRYLPTGQYVSILSPLGVALLGLTTGDRMPFTDLQGMPTGVTVAEVAYSPGYSRHAGRQAAN